MTLGLEIFSSPLALSQFIPLNAKPIWNSCSKKLNSVLLFPKKKKKSYKLSSLQGGISYIYIYMIFNEEK